MGASVSLVQSALADTISAIASQAPLVEWPQVLDNLAMSLADPATRRGALLAAHSIFKPWRSQFPSDGLYIDIKLALEKFAPTHLALLNALTQLICGSPNPVTFADDVECVGLLVKIFLSFNSLDLPEFFEDNQHTYMTNLHLLLTYNLPAHPQFKTDANIELLNKLKSSICECVLLYARKYEPEFVSLPEFVNDIWALLSAAPVNGDGNNEADVESSDLLVGHAISVLTALVGVERLKGLFSGEGCLEGLCGMVVLRNCVLTGKSSFLF